MEEIAEIWVLFCGGGGEGGGVESYALPVLVVALWIQGMWCVSLKCSRTSSLFFFSNHFFFYLARHSSRHTLNISNSYQTC